MPIIHVVPAVDERVKVVRLCTRRLVLAKSQRRGGARAGVLGTRRTKRNRGPRLVRPNEVDSRYLRAEAFICRGVTEDPYVSTGTERSADGQVPAAAGVNGSRVCSSWGCVIRKAEPVPVAAAPLVEEALVTAVPSALREKEAREVAKLVLAGRQHEHAGVENIRPSNVRYGGKFMRNSEEM